MLAGHNLEPGRAVHLPPQHLRRLHRLLQQSAHHNQLPLGMLLQPQLTLLLRPYQSHSGLRFGRAPARLLGHRRRLLLLRLPETSVKAAESYVINRLARRPVRGLHFRGNGHVRDVQHKKWGQRTGLSRPSCIPV